MITPHILTRIEQYAGIVTPSTSDKGVSLNKQVKLALLNPVQYARLLNTDEFYKDRFIVANIVNAVLANPVVKNMIFDIKHIENSYQHWTEPKYDLACSAKVDYMNATGIVDIRLTSCTNLSEFALQCYSYKYHRTAAFVSDGLNKGNYIIIGVNKKKYNTFTVNMHTIMGNDGKSSWITEGRAEYEELIDKLLCMDEVTRDQILETTF